MPTSLSIFVTVENLYNLLLISFLQYHQVEFPRVTFFLHFIHLYKLSFFILSFSNLYYLLFLILTSISLQIYKSKPDSVYPPILVVHRTTLHIHPSEWISNLLDFPSFLPFAPPFFSNNLSKELFTYIPIIQNKKTTAQWIMHYIA